MDTPTNVSYKERENNTKMPKIFLKHNSIIEGILPLVVIAYQSIIIDY